MQNVVILGSTGSIGVNTLEVIKLNFDKFKVFGLTANNSADKLLLQCIEFIPNYVVILDKSKAIWLQQELIKRNLKIEVLSTSIDLEYLVANSAVDIVMSAIVGSSGLLPTYAAIKANKKVLLANKESLVAAGQLIINELLRPGNKAELIPVDSEHSAIFQSLPTKLQKKPYVINEEYGINKIILTASGGPFRTYTTEELNKVTPENALKHPNWSMGPKISIDSSTLMNKGLEVIEAHWLFGGVKIDVVVHPQSIIHSMVEYVDGSIISQMGMPDMKTPIAYALSYPNRIKSGSAYLDFIKYSNLTFEPVDYVRFPCLKLAFDALKSGGAMPAVLNAANEIAVEMFLKQEISYKDIHKYVAKTMEKFVGVDYNSVDELLNIDQNARLYLRGLV
jgi:1-deoxy-D-xylulose-5-phosphate reductoisomerase